MARRKRYAVPVEHSPTYHKLTTVAALVLMLVPFLICAALLVAGAS